MAVTGGGLSGLAFAIQCAKAGYRVAVFEKETYPFHKVCGEYISNESWNFLQELAWAIKFQTSPQKTSLSECNCELFHCSGHSDVEQSSFLFECNWSHFNTSVRWENVIFKPDQENIRILESFRTGQ